MKKIVIVFTIFMMSLLSVTAQEGEMDETPRMAVMSAFAPELSILLEATNVEETYTINGIEFTTGELEGVDVVLFLSGVSIINAAMNTQLALNHFNITEIVFSGIAGGVNPDLHIGTVTVPEQWGNYQETIYGRDMGDGTYDTSAVSRVQEFENFGMAHVRAVEVGGESYFWFPVDEEMLSVAESVAETVELENCVADVCLTTEPEVVVGGNGVSGPTFVDNAEYRQYAYETFEANVLDMESASAAVVAFANGVPFIAFRSLSDLAGGSEEANEIGTFFQLASDNSAAVVMAFLEAWANR